ncbi:MAG: response regulator [Anaerolineae bacterium]|nr:response regulator [Anaerolineae bacterium]
MMSKTASILLVEDDLAILEGMADLLQLYDLNYDVRVQKATNGEEGLAVMAGETPDLIISDIMMPEMNGFEFLAAVRANSRWVHIPFIFLTAKGTKEEILEGRRSGAELYITKPFIGDELLELVKTQLDRSFELRQVRDQRIDSLKRNVLQLLNHEFRTPLTYVTAYYEMLADSLLEADDASMLQEYLRGIQVGSQRLATLVEDLIKIISIRTGEAHTLYQRDARRIDNVGTLLHQRAQAIAPAAAQHNIRLKHEIAPKLPSIFGVPALISDMFDRLLDNALKFTQVQPRPEKAICVRAATADGEVHLAVEDTGIGFPPHIAGLLFDLFFQYNRERLEQQGSGAGLAIVKGYAELHHARIEVDSDVGVGSRFTLVFPVYGRAASQVQTDSDQRPRATVLVVEDDPHLLDGLKELLELADVPYRFHVLTAGNGAEGLALLERYQPDLIISDVMMPVMGGYEFLRQVRANPAWLQIPFIFLTAKGEREDIHRGRRSGVEEYITKPYDIDELVDLTIAQLDRHFQRQGAMNQSFESLKRSILGMLQPDFRDPLNLVTSYSQKLAESLERAETDAELMASLQGIQAGSQRVTRLVEDFIAVAEYKTGEARSAFAIRAERLPNVGALLYEAVYDRVYGQPELGIQFQFGLLDQLPPVLGDRERLLSTFRRLIDALIALGPDGAPAVLRLASRVTDGSVALMVAVSASKISAGATAKIAEFLAGDDEVLEVPSYGPSLTVVKWAIRLHDGRIELGELENGGLVIRILLPVLAHASTPKKP